MHYKYLEQWVNENSSLKLTVKEITKFRDQIFIGSMRSQKGLHINLSSENSFIFHVEKPLHDFTRHRELNTFNQHLQHAKLKEINMHSHDRVITLIFEYLDLYNHLKSYKLVLELIPHYQNIVLLGNNDVILDCLRKVSYAENRHRQVLPGLVYQPPPAFQVDRQEVNYPLKFDDNGKIMEAAVDGYKEMNSFFAAYYQDYILTNKLESERKQQSRSIDKEIKKKIRKLKKQESEYKEAESGEKWKQYGELLKSHLHLVKKGDEYVTVTNYYDSDYPQISIPIKKDKSPQANVELYFKKYRKARDGKDIIAKQIEKTKQEIKELGRKRERVQYEVYLTDDKSEPAQKSKKYKFRKLDVDNDWQIIVGRSAKENDFLITKVAQSWDWWFHTRIFHGTHVILRNFAKKEMPDELLRLCCRLAAYYSKAKQSVNVPVDYTQVRYLRKPRGSAAGFVTYTNQKTLFVDPLSFREARAYLATRAKNAPNKR
jgi:predicted ribosome quality control (RQC) complex YloA/Tae2 family protein